MDDNGVMSERESVKIGLLGCGNVGSAVARLVVEHDDLLAARAGAPIEIARVAVRDLAKVRDAPISPDRFTDDPESIVTDPEIAVIVEVMGGIEPAFTLVATALKARKPVVTGNKELLASRGVELFEAAEEAGVDLLFEASVGGGIPLIRPLRESLAGDRITRVMGIVNGTTNYVLTRMTEEGTSFAEALAEAQALGYAEADPTSDIDGVDAAAKAAIIASIAFGAQVTVDEVHCEGISSVTADDIASAHDLGYVVKLLAVAEGADDEIAVRVHPAMVPEHHPLAAVRESFNALFLEGDAVGELMFYGRGAGGGPSASAVLGDLVDAVRNLAPGGRGATIGKLARKRIRSIDDVVSQFYVSMDVADRPGVLAQISGAFGDHGVSILSMQQHGLGEEARLSFVTHRAREADVRATLRSLDDLEAVQTIRSVLRVMGEDE